MERFVIALLFVALPLVKSNVCPDGSTCPGVETCCSSSSGYRCCPYAGGYCCSDGNYCCAAGYICVLDICILPSSSGNNHQRTEVVALSKKVKESKLNQCPPGMTECGETPSGTECCPYPNAVCCSDGAHCCPSGYTCDVPNQQCIKNVAIYNLKNSNPLRKMQSMKYPANAEMVALTRKVEESMVSQCPSGMTECGETPSGVECCPYPNAVCCSDGAHCCPSGYTCDLPDQQCIKNVGIYNLKNSNPLRKMQSVKYPANAEMVALTRKVEESMVSQCPSGMTECGETPSGVECCPYPNAVCCSDGAHCCPSGYTCDLPDQQCVKNIALNNVKHLYPIVKKMKMGQATQS